MAGLSLGLTLSENVDLDSAESHLAHAPHPNPHVVAHGHYGHATAAPHYAGYAPVTPAPYTPHAHPGPYATNYHGYSKVKYST